MTATKSATSVFDPVSFGKELRTRRRKAGYMNSPDLSKAIQQRTGVYIDQATIMRYERGEREPDVSKLIAIVVTLYAEDWCRELTGLLCHSMPHNSLTKNLIAARLVGSTNELETMIQAASYEKLRTALHIADEWNIPLHKAERLASFFEADAEQFDAMLTEFGEGFQKTLVKDGWSAFGTTNVYEAFADWWIEKYGSSYQDAMLADAKKSIGKVDAWLNNNFKSADQAKPAQ